MKLRETSLATKAINPSSMGVNDLHNLIGQMEIIGDSHMASSAETPMRPDAFDLSADEKIAQIAHKMHEVLHILGMDLNDESLKGTPLRVAKMYVNEVFGGLLPENKPDAKLFPNTFKYNELLVEKNIKVHSYCEHHLVPIVGVAHVAYISNGFVIGLSKINRIVRYFSKRPQVQERLNEQIAAELKKALKTEDVAVLIDAEHFCVKTRGIEDDHSSTLTAHYSGRFKEIDLKNEFLKHVYKS